MKWGAAIIFFLMATPSHGASLCGAHDALKAALKGRYSETKFGMGLALSENLIEISKSKNGDTWTILVTTPEGETCVIAAGQQWIEVVQETGGEKL